MRTLHYDLPPAPLLDPIRPNSIMLFKGNRYFALQPF
jgi:hypothetical protein